MVFGEHFTEHNQAEVKTDLQFLIEQQCFETKSALKNFKQEVSTHFSDEKLTHTIQQLFQKITGQRDDNLCNEQTTPAHDFIAQLCLIRCGFSTYTKIDSDFGSRSQAGVRELKKLYNTKYKLTPFKPIEENEKADSEFFKAVLEIIAQTPRPTRIEKSIGIDMVDTLERTYFLGHSFVEGYPTKNKLGIKGATINALNKEIRNSPSQFREGVTGKTLVIDLGINDLYAKNATPETVVKDYTNLLGTIRNKEKGNYNGPIHIIGISEVTKMIQNKTVGESNTWINKVNHELEKLAYLFPNIIFHPRTLAQKNIAPDGLHAKDSTEARDQVLQLVYSKKSAQNSPLSSDTARTRLDPLEVPQVVQQATTKNSIETKNNFISTQLDEGKTVIFSDTKVLKGTIEQFIPEKPYSIILNYAKTSSPYTQFTNVTATRDAQQKTYVVDAGMPSRLGKRAYIYPGVQVTAKARDALSVAKLTPTKTLQITDNHRIEISESVSMKIERIFSSILQKHTEIKKDFITFAHNFNLGAQEVTDLALVVYNENREFKKGNARTPIGQLGKPAREDAYRELGLGEKIPPYSKKNRYNQLVATYGYAKLCGVFDASDETAKKIAYTKYNLGPYRKQTLTSAKTAFENQADEMKGYAQEFAVQRGRRSYNYQDILDAEYTYYTVGKEQIS